MNIENDCVFCKIANHEVDSIVVQEDESVMAIMDQYPATLGHVLVLPKRHIENIYSMPVDLVVVSHIMAITIALAKAIKKQLSPVGLNLVQANEVAAGQTIPHFHLHVVPRYSGDPVLLKFGHGMASERIDELEKTASLIKLSLVMR